MFDIESYMRELCASNRFATEHNYTFCTCSGIESLEGPLNQFRTASAFFCLDDTNDGALFRGRGGGWYRTRTFTVFLMHRYRAGDLADRAEKLGWCRELFRQIISKMLVDEESLSNDMIYLRTSNVLSRELGQYFLNGCTGLYFMLEMSEPVDLVYNNAEWN